jgi:type II secretory pathway pseudopilin PulG
VPVTYGAVAGILLVVIATLALVVLPPAPPSVAEFAPQAQDQIGKALDQQSSQFGTGTGECATGLVCEGIVGSGGAAGVVAAATTTTVPKRVIDRARNRLRA